MLVPLLGMFSKHLFCFTFFSVLYQCIYLVAIQVYASCWASIDWYPRDQTGAASEQLLGLSFICRAGQLSRLYYAPQIKEQKVL